MEWVWQITDKDQYVRVLYILYVLERSVFLSVGSVFLLYWFSQKSFLLENVSWKLNLKIAICSNWLFAKSPIAIFLTLIQGNKKEFRTIKTNSKNVGSVICQEILIIHLSLEYFDFFCREKTTKTATTKFNQKTSSVLNEKRYQTEIFSICICSNKGNQNIREGIK